MINDMINLDGTWQFWKDPQSNLELNDLKTVEAIPLQIPAPWQAHPDLRDYQGTAWLQTLVHIPEDWCARGLVLLQFGAVDYFAQVWWNGQCFGEHEGGYLPFEMDISAAVLAGDNLLTVRVSDPIQIFPEIPHGKQSWYGQISGIWQSVNVTLRSLVHLRTIRLTPSGSSVICDVELNQPLPSGYTLGYTLLSPSGKLCQQIECTELSVQMDIESVQWWSPDEPNLYTMQVGLIEGDQTVDQRSEVFGFRTLETNNGQLILNGKPFYLRGALDQDYYPQGIYTPPSIEFIEDLFRKAKLMGFNCLRIHIKIGDPRYYQVADRMGMLIWTELPNVQTLSQAARKRMRETIQGMVQRDWNHPSIGIWTIINENWGTNLTFDAEQRVWLVETYHWLKEIDPNRLVVDNSPCHGNAHVITDIADFHIYYAIPDHARQWQKWVVDYASRPDWLFTPSFKNEVDQKSYLKNPFDVNANRPFAAQVHQRGDEPMIVSEFGNWGLPDVAQLRAFYGGQDPWWFGSGWDWGEGVVAPMGAESRFGQFGLQRSFADFSELSRASQWMQYSALKFEIEEMRRHAQIGGYVITEMTDVLWESNGVLDMVRNPKVYFKELGYINQDNLIIPQTDRVAYWCGETCEVTVDFSCYNPEGLEESQLTWSFGGKVTDSIRLKTFTHFGVSRIGNIRFTIPEVSQPVQMYLVLHIEDKNGAILCQNQQVVYIFPKPAISQPGLRIYAPELSDALQVSGYQVVDRPEEADLAILKTLDQAALTLIRLGLNVIWLAEERDALQTVESGFGLGQREGTSRQGDWASSFSWIHRDGLFKDLPTSGCVDMSFLDLTPDMVVFENGINAYRGQVHAGLFVGWLHRFAALIIERQYGDGKILASTFKISNSFHNHPVARYLLECMILHLMKKR